MDLCFGRSSETKSRFKGSINPTFVVRNLWIQKAPDVACIRNLPGIQISRSVIFPFL